MRRAVAAGLVVVAGATLWVSYQLSLDRTLLLADDPTVPRSPGTPGPAAGPTASPAVVITGPVVETGYGPIQVEVTLAGERLERSRAVVVPESSERSVSISERAVPLLDASAVEVQSAQLDTVTGATFTSDGYRRSLQAALDAARGR